MKLTMEVDCTPEEARDFIGLPNLKPLQANVLARIEQQLLEATSALSPQAVLQSWFTALPQAPEHYMKLMTDLMKMRPASKTDAR